LALYKANLCQCVGIKYEFFFQLDNQLAGAVFSTVLAPVPPPKTVAAESGQYENYVFAVWM